MYPHYPHRSYMHRLFDQILPCVDTYTARLTRNLHSAVFFSLQSLCLTHTGKPMGVAVSHCITWFQTQLIVTACQIRYHSHLWDHRSTGQL